MVAPNRRRVVRNHEIVVTLSVGKPEASIAIQPHTGRPGGLHPPRRVSLQPYLAGGLSETEALELIIELVSIGVEGST
jgi:hypothetical protein